MKNRFVLVNKLPLGILTHVATLFERDRDLINATAVCQFWRNTLLSYPRLWCNASGSRSKIQAYIQRSQSIPLYVDLSDPSLVDLIDPHASRLAGLTVFLGKSSKLNQFFEHLHRPTPMLHTLGISAAPSHPHPLEFPSGPDDPFFLHSKKLEFYGISKFLGFQTFPSVTEFTWHTSYSCNVKIPDLLELLERLPLLERVHIVFCLDASLDTSPYKLVTLPHVQEMSLRSEERRVGKECW